MHSLAATSPKIMKFAIHVAGGNLYVQTLKVLRKVSRHREASSTNFIIAELVSAFCCICTLGADN